MTWLFVIAYMAIGVWVARRFILGMKEEDQEKLDEWEQRLSKLEAEYRRAYTIRYPQKPEVYSETQLRIIALLLVPTWLALALGIALVYGPEFVGKLILWKLPPTRYELNKRIAELEEWHRKYSAD